MLKTLMKYIGEFKKETILTPVFIILEAIMEAMIPLLMALIIDQGVEKGNMKYVVLMGIAMLVVAFTSLAFGVIAGKTAAKASAGYARNLRSAMFANIQEFSFSNIDKYSTAGLVTRMTTDVTNVQNAFQMIIRIFVRAPFMLISALAMSLYINARLSLIFVVAIIFLGGSLYLIMTKAHPYFVNAFRKYDDLNASVQENLTGIRVVKAYVREEHEVGKFHKACESVYRYNHAVIHVCQHHSIILAWCEDDRWKQHDNWGINEFIYVYDKYLSQLNDSFHGIHHGNHGKIFSRTYCRNLRRTK